MSRRASTVVVTTFSLLTLLMAVACSADSGSRGGPGQPSATSGRTASPSPAASPSSTPPRGATPSRGQAARVSQTITDDLDSPWGLAFLPDGTALVGSRDTAQITLIGKDGAKRVLGTVPGVSAAGEGGLLGLAVPSTFATDHDLYAYFTASHDNRIVRIKLFGTRLGKPSVILDGIPKGFIHNGGRIAFGPDGMLYAGTGESGDTGLAQDKRSLGGKILRMTPGGAPAPGNPFPGSVVYSFGHRNVQGLAWDPDGRLWASEFGQNTWDELNLIKPGRNYGWPEVEGMVDGDQGRYQNPVVQWHTDQASPSGIAYAEGAIWLAGLRGARLWRVPVAGERAGTPQAFLIGEYGRLRTLALAGDGALWLSTSNTDGRGEVHDRDDRILRLTIG